MFKEAVKGTHHLSPISGLAALIGLRAALDEIDPYTIDPSVTLFLARVEEFAGEYICLLYTSPSPRD